MISLYLGKSGTRAEAAGETCRVCAASVGWWGWQGYKIPCLSPNISAHCSDNVGRSPAS